MPPLEEVEPDVSPLKSAPAPEPEPEPADDEPNNTLPPEGTVCQVCGRRGRAEGHH